MGWLLVFTGMVWKEFQVLVGVVSLIKESNKITLVQDHTRHGSYYSESGQELQK